MDGAPNATQTKRFVVTPGLATHLVRTATGANMAHIGRDMSSNQATKVVYSYSRFRPVEIPRGMALMMTVTMAK